MLTKKLYILKFYEYLIFQVIIQNAHVSERSIQKGRYINAYVLLVR